MITLSNLKKTFGETTACDIPALTINDGDVIGLVGNNGAGKTTLFRMILDLLKPDEGHVEIDNINPADSETWKEFTAAYIDEGFLIDYLTPEEYFAFIAKVSNIPQTEAEERIKALSRLDAGEVTGQKKLIRNLSAGNRQKVGIMAALMRQPKLLILDEPFNFLDPSGQILLKQTLSEYNRATGATLLISSHNLQHTVDISSRIILLEKGKVISDLENTDGSAKDSLIDYFNAE